MGPLAPKCGDPGGDWKLGDNPRHSASPVCTAAFHMENYLSGGSMSPSCRLQPGQLRLRDAESPELVTSRLPGHAPLLLATDPGHHFGDRPFAASHTLLCRGPGEIAR